MADYWMAHSSTADRSMDATPELAMVQHVMVQHATVQHATVQREPVRWASAQVAATSSGLLPRR
jgi:hypothetical protein